MYGKSLGLIETVGLAAAVEAADAALKSANVELAGCEQTKGGGLMLVTLTGEVGAVNAAVAAGVAAASRVSRVYAYKVIARTAEGVEKLIQQDAAPQKTPSFAESKTHAGAPSAANSLPATAETPPGSNPQQANPAASENKIRDDARQQANPAASENKIRDDAAQETGALPPASATTIHDSGTTKQTTASGLPVTPQSNNGAAAEAKAPSNTPPKKSEKPKPAGKKSKK